LNNLFDHTKFRESLFDFNISSFSEKALQLFHFQYRENRVYRQYCDMLGIDPGKVTQLSSIPFLPVGFFKTHRVMTGSFEPEMFFESSGTSGSINSRHMVKEASLYRESFLHGFRKFYGEPSSWCIIGLLPSYLERRHSSLVMMVDELVRLTGHPKSGFYLYDHEKLYESLLQLEISGQKTLLIGVTYALLDFAEKFPMSLKHTIVMETGGMKGRREEMTRTEVHEILQQQWELDVVHSEYGMTELLSQGYSKGQGIFHTSDTMKVMIREEDDPLDVHKHGVKEQRGIINIIDLANIWSCAFIATEDAGRLLPDGSFEVTGRVDYSDIRGCSLMVV
jgi:Acyl-protein synthetase, LuxE